MQTTSYEIDSDNIEKPFEDSEAIVNIVNACLNAEEEIFNVAFINNKEQFNKDNLIYKEQVQGVLQLKTTSLSTSNDGTEIKELSITLMIPLNAKNNYFNNCVNTLIKNVNNQQFDISDTVGITFQNMQVVDANKLAKPINGVEYEIVIVTGTIITSKCYLQATTQYVLIDDVKLDGAITINYTTLKTTDPDVFGLKDPIQRNTVNGIQIAIEIDMQFYKSDSLHRQLLYEAEDKKEYQITYFNGFFTKTYPMILLQASVTGIVGDSVKGKLSFVIGE